MLATCPLAEYQSDLLQIVLERFPLTAREKVIVQRGKNSAAVKGNKRKPMEYNNASAFEALLGFLYISNRTRCEELLNFVSVHLDEAD